MQDLSLLFIGAGAMVFISIIVGMAIGRYRERKAADKRMLMLIDHLNCNRIKWPHTMTAEQCAEMTHERWN